MDHHHTSGGRPAGRTAAGRSRTSDCDVLIVGAGPSGLILAHELLRRGVRCRALEKRRSPSGSTRAFTLHARTMEMFDHMGVAARIDELREVCPGNLFHFKGIKRASTTPMLDFRRLPGTRYAYYGKVNQNDLDQALRRELAGKYSFHPEFHAEYLSSEPVEDGVVARVRHGHGETAREELIRARWLVGADGSQSAVRRGLGSRFEQRDGATMTMSMMDVELDGFRGDRSWVNYFVAAEGFMLVTGLPGGVYRLYLAGAMERLLDDRPPRDAFQSGLDYFETGAAITGVQWSSSWVIRKIVGETYLQGRTILCGDATHVHSPAGGQGMNACMQDAFNLGWKLALVVRGEADAGVLDSYQRERRPIAEQVTEGADRMHQILFNAGIPMARRFELTQNPAWHDDSILRISALSHHYRGADGVDSGSIHDAAIRPGERAPDCSLSAQAPHKRLYDTLRHPGFTALLLDRPEAGSLDQIDSIAAQLRSRFGSLVKPVLVARQAVDSFDYDHTIIDHDGIVGRTYGGGDEAQIILIRPDLYVGAREPLAAAPAARYLARWLEAP